ncbi:MAG TPA: carbohydrate-binding family 9-like protein [Bryobacterales bacterium]|nr:carbohydrate-binding family 9-like protein [Bryobacterales bacterium]
MNRLCLFFLLAAALAAQPVKLPVYGARKTVDHIRIDGKLDEFSWAGSPRLQEFRLIHDVTRRPKFPTEGAVLWDGQNLYVSFACRDRQPWSRFTHRDDHLWEEEVVEVFLDPDGDGKNYAELEVSPKNVVVDLLIPSPRAGAGNAIKWDIEGLETAVGHYAAGWTAEIAIPWKSLGGTGITSAPKPGDRWRVGLYRIKRPGGPGKADEIAALSKEMKSAGAARKAEIEQKLRELRADDEYQAWSPTRPERGFHDPERFGIVEFLDLDAQI